MKKYLFIILIGLSTIGFSQDFKIDTTVTFGGGLTSPGPNYIKQIGYPLIKVNDSTYRYEAQFVTCDSSGNKLIPNNDLLDNGWRSNGTVRVFTVPSDQAELKPDSLRTLFILPDLNNIYWNKVTKE